MVESRVIHKLLSDSGVDGFVITHSPHIVWATGFVSSNALLYITCEQTYVVTDSRFAVAVQSLQGVEPIIANQEGFASALQSYIAPKTARVGYQSEYMSVHALEQLRTAFPDAKLVPLPGLLNEAVAPKYQAEVACLQRAQQITETVFDEVIQLLKPGITEKELAAEVIYRQLQHGADGISPEFWPIVSFGSNSAMPHARPTDRALVQNEAVLLDFGCTFAGYCSDMTRTALFGEPNDEFRNVYETVLRAQEAAISAVKAGVMAREVDAVARSIIGEAGYGDNFGHGLGHGVGLEIHEWPVLNPRSKDILLKNTAVTVEPGIYLPGKFGIRIEDLVIVKADGVLNLTSANKQLQTI